MRKGYNKVSAYLVCRDAGHAVDFYKKHFGAEEDYRLAGPDGIIMHCEMMIGDCRIMISDEFPDSGVLSPISLGGSPISLNIYVDNVDDLLPKLQQEGCEVLSPLQLQFHGDKSAKFSDPFGHIWHVATNVEDVSSDEVVARFNKMMSD
ncbi:MAG: VOC family protein [Rhizobiaceae bacterium]|nr:VOC family protein [Rhizobiaceae bacterium]